MASAARCSHPAAAIFFRQSGGASCFGRSALEMEPAGGGRPGCQNHLEMSPSGPLHGRRLHAGHPGLRAAHSRTLSGEAVSTYLRNRAQAGGASRPVQVSPFAFLSARTVRSPRPRSRKANMAAQGTDRRPGSPPYKVDDPLGIDLYRRRGVAISCHELPAHPRRSRGGGGCGGSCEKARRCDRRCFFW
jgi:hypothetical protein